MNDTNPSLLLRMCRMIKPDWVFGLLLILVLSFLVKQIFGGDGDEAQKFAMMLAALLFLTFLAVLGARFDKRTIEDYAYQLMAHAAIVALVTTMLAVALFDWFAGNQAPLSGRDALVILLGSWSLSFFYFRWRGINP